MWVSKVPVSWVIFLLVALNNVMNSNEVENSGSMGFKNPYEILSSGKVSDLCEKLL